MNKKEFEVQVTRLNGWIIGNSQSYVSVLLSGHVLLGQVDAGETDAIPTAGGAEKKPRIYTLVIRKGAVT